MPNLRTLNKYMRSEAEHGMLEDYISYERRGVIGIAICAINAYGDIAGPAEDWDDHEQILRASHISMRRKIYVPRIFGDEATPDDLAARVSEKYPFAEVIQIPDMFQTPGVTYPGPPVRGGAGLHESGAFGRYGAAGLMLWHEPTDSFLLVQHNNRFYEDFSFSQVRLRGPKLWRPAGAHIKYADQNPVDSAIWGGTRELQLTHYTPTDHLGTASLSRRGWTYHVATFRVQERPEMPYRTPQGIEAAEWFTRNQVRDLIKDGKAFPQLKMLFPDICEHTRR